MFCFLGPWFCLKFRANRLYMSNDTFQYKCGGVKAYKKRKGLVSGCCSLNFVYGNESVTHSAQSKFSWRNGIFFVIFSLEYLSRRSEKVDGHFANCRFSFRDLLIFISVLLHFVLLHFVSQTTVSPN